MKQFRYFLPVAALLAGCKPDLKLTAPSANGLDFSTYVSVGNSLTAGYASNSLTRESQESSYPSILARQFKTVGGGEFKQPLLPGNAGYPDRVLVLGYSTDCKGVRSLGPVDYSATLDTAGSAANISAQGPFNNTGVPGIRCIDALSNGYAIFNPYAARFYKDLFKRPLDEMTRLPATFFTCWLGSNDVLGYATSGGEGGLFSGISDETTFRTNYDSVVNAMTRNGAKGVLIGIPDVTVVPFFTTIPYNGLTLTAAEAATQNTTYAGTGISFAEGANNFVIQDPAAPDGFRKIYDDELVLLSTPQDSLKCAGWGAATPIPKSYILSRDEIAACKAATNTFNGIIMNAAVTRGLAFVDINTYLKTFNPGLVYNGVSFNTTFVSGSAFSLDGVHLTPRGYALVANEIIRTINAHYGSTVPEADVNGFGGLKFT